NIGGHKHAMAHNVQECKKPHKAAFHRRYWRRRSESNRRRRLCRPLHDHSATPPGATACVSKRAGRANEKGGPREGRATNICYGLSLEDSGAGNESRTRDLNLGKVALYQLSYSRVAQP